MFRFSIGHLLKRDLQQVNEPFNKSFVRSFLLTLTVIDNTIRMLTGSVNVYRYTAIRMYVINIKQERVVYILLKLNISRAFFLSFFLTLAQRKHVFFASSLLSNCMRSRILSNYLNQIFYQVFFFKGSPNVNFQFLDLLFLYLNFYFCGLI